LTRKEIAMLPNWLYGKSKSKLADILGGGGGGGTTYTAGPGISISSDNKISFRGDTAPYNNNDSGLEADTVKGAIDELAEDVAVENATISTSDTYIDTTPRNAIYKVCGVKSFVLQATIKVELTQGTTYTIGTLPDGYRPLYNNGYVKEVLCSGSGIRALIEIDSARSLKITPRSGNISAQSSILLAETFI
jgi:hypothetical protein